MFTLRTHVLSLTEQPTISILTSALMVTHAILVQIHTHLVTTPVRQLPRDPHTTTTLVRSAMGTKIASMGTANREFVRELEKVVAVMTTLNAIQECGALMIPASPFWLLVLLIVLLTTTVLALHV